MTRQVTEIRLTEHGDETHESWLLVRANRYTSTGTRLFDSDIPHQQFVGVTITRCSRKRDLHRDWLHAEEVLMEFSLSQAQWGAFVSSFGDGSGVPATLTFLTGAGMVPQAPGESRLDESHREVREAASEAVKDLTEAYERVMTVFNGGGGKRDLREALRTLGIRIGNTPSNMAFAAESLTEHVENVVTKARADIEGMVLAAVERGELPPAAPRLLTEEGMGLEGAMINPAYDAALKAIEDRLIRDRDAGDTHDYSSSGYNGFDDGYISGVGDTIEAVREVFDKELEVCGAGNPPPAEHPPDRSY